MQRSQPNQRGPRSRVWPQAGHSSQHLSKSPLLRTRSDANETQRAKAAGVMTPVHLALVGLGAFGMRYLSALRAMPGVRLAWVCDRDEGRCRAATQSSGTRWSTDFLEVCTSPETDAVLVVTPETAHRAIAVAAMESGKHVIVEKPLATTDEDALAMIEASEHSGKLLMTAMLLRFDVRYARLKERLPEIGAIRSLYAYRNFDRSLFKTYSRTHSFVENAIHDIDLLLWYVGSPVERVHGFCRNTLGLQNPDVNWGVLEFESGAVAGLQTTWLYPPQRHDNLQWNAGLQIMGERGVLETRQDSQGLTVHSEESGLALLDQSGWADLYQEPRGALGGMLRHMMACLRGETAYRGATPREALEAMRVARRLVADSEREERRP